jgi:hypothetical protein
MVVKLRGGGGGNGLKKGIALLPVDPCPHIHLLPGMKVEPVLRGVRPILIPQEDKELAPPPKEERTQETILRHAEVHGLRTKVSPDSNPGLAFHGHHVSWIQDLLSSFLCRKPGPKKERGTAPRILTFLQDRKRTQQSPLCCCCPIM